MNQKIQAIIYALGANPVHDVARYLFKNLRFFRVNYDYLEKFPEQSKVIASKFLAFIVAPFYVH